MASIFKRKRRVKLANGKKRVKKSACWYVEYRDKDGKVRRVKGYRDLAATRQKAAQHRKRPLSEHLEDFRKSLQVGNTKTYVKITYSRIKRVFDDCGFCYWDDLSASRIKDYLTTLEISKKTFNYYLTAVKQFCHWMV
ncbi:hypothetical protein ACFL1G_11775, partial [Planctomycetota bacterium]